MLELFYDSKDKIPAGFESLYTEKDGKWALTGVKGMKTQEDIDRMQTGLTKERTEHKATKAALAKYTPLGEADALTTIVDEHTQWKTERESSGNTDEAIEARVQARVTAATAPLQRQLETAEASVVALTEETTALKGTIARRGTEDHIRGVATEAKIRDTAMADVLFIGSSMFEQNPDTGEYVARKDVPGVEVGTPFDTWLEAQKEARPHWWPETAGGGAGGGNGDGAGGVNPWSAKGWNIEAQARLVASDRPKAERMAQAAGSGIGQMTPPAA